MAAGALVSAFFAVSPPFPLLPLPLDDESVEELLPESDEELLLLLSLDDEEVAAAYEPRLSVL